jgi:hypothetical protein
MHAAGFAMLQDLSCSDVHWLHDSCRIKIRVRKSTESMSTATNAEGVEPVVTTAFDARS